MAINLLKGYAKAMAAMAAVEGEGWLAYQAGLATRATPCSIHQAMATLELCRSRKSGGIAVATIYGSGGYDRYFVYPDGTVKFSRSHAIGQSAVETAEREGIEIL